MIFVEEQPEPDVFEEIVRQRGLRFLRNTPKPTTREFAAHSYWRNIEGDLYNAYGGICAYTCHWMSLDTGWRTVEHFIPKSVRPSLAYEWRNFRLVCGRLNARKGIHQDVMDPFCITGVVFVIDFPSLLIKPDNGLSLAEKDIALKTIARLRLNDDETCVAARLNYVKEYCTGDISFDFLRRCAPFIHREIIRQGLEPEIRDVMSIPLIGI